MKIAVFGVTGLTGGLVVTQALAQGHDIVALVRGSCIRSQEFSGTVLCTNHCWEG